MKYTIKFAGVKHARIRIGVDNIVSLTIPKKKMFDTKLKEKLLEKAKKMLEKKNAKKRLPFISQGNNFQMIFGEKKEEILSQEAQEDLLIKKSLPLLEKYTSLLSVSYKTLKVRDYKSKWGSCSHDDKISLNLKLIHLDTIFLEYVIVHEICHIKEKNHSKDFWNLVESLFPQYKEVRKELKQLVL